MSGTERWLARPFEAVAQTTDMAAADVIVGQGSDGRWKMEKNRFAPAREVTPAEIKVIQDRIDEVAVPGVAITLSMVGR